MCRLYAFHANEETKVECSLVHAQNSLLIQSQGDSVGRVHSDGWGIGYYVDNTPILEKNFTAAFHGLHFSESAERVYARTVVAHVRLATVGINSLDNCHPFCWGNWVFAHNGTVVGIDLLRVELLAEMGEQATHIRGSTDSECLFHWLVSRLLSKGAINELQMLDQRQAVKMIASSLTELDVRCSRADSSKEPKLNIVLTDGSNLIACRLRNTLSWVSRRGIHDCEICGIPHIHHQSTVDYRAVVVASEPISSEPWQEIPDGTVIWVDSSLETGMHSM
ncbi:MAG: class II glutamine amidotransferase [Planctomycetales bacterium]|nr:class II glutamine amidotransferase [Planctomycetales bacterium]